MEIEKIEKSILDILPEEIYLYDVEYRTEGGYSFLTIYLEEKINGVYSSPDLLKVSDISKLIDDKINEYIDEKVFLEISSPGLERKLKKIVDFKRFLNSKINVKTKSNINGKKQFTGILLDVIEESIKLDIEDTLIPIDKIKEAKIIYEINIGEEE